MDIKDLLNQISYQHDWRADYNECFNYINGKQLTDEQLERAKKLNLHPRSFNLIRAPMMTLQGNEIKTRVDFLLKARNEESVNATSALNAELNRAEKTIQLNQKITKAFYNAAVGGCGFIKVGENDKVGNKYKAEVIHAENFYWDLQRDGELLDNAAWCVIRHIISTDEAKALYPKHKTDIENQKGSGNSFTFSNGNDFSFSQNFGRTFRHQVINDQDDTITVHELYYKKESRAEIFTGTDGEQYDVKDLGKDIIADLRLGKKTQWKTKTKIMRKVYLGWMMIEDKPTNQPHNYFPIVPIFNELSNEWNTPIGIIYYALEPQKQYNEHRLEMQKIMRNKQVFYEEGSIVNMTADEIANEANRADSIFAVKEGSQFPVIKREFADLAKFDRLIELDKELIRECTGLTNSFTGDSKGLSGKAIAASSELASNSVVSLFDARDKAKTRIGEILLSHIISDMGDEQQDVALEDNTKRIKINSETEQGEVLNPIAEIRYSIELASIKSSSGFRQLQSERLATMANNAKEPTTQAVLQLLALELEDVPRKEYILPAIAKKLGLEGLNNDKDANEELEQQQAQQMAQQQQMAQAEMELVTQERQAEIELKKAETMLKLAQAETEYANADAVDAEAAAEEAANATANKPPKNYNPNLQKEMLSI